MVLINLRVAGSSVRLSDVVRALTKAIALVTAGGHDPIKAHERVKSMYNWEEVTKRTEVVYSNIMKREPIDLWTRMHR